jgi:hypothetical protein
MDDSKYANLDKVDLDDLEQELDRLTGEIVRALKGKDVMILAKYDAVIEELVIRGESIK